VEAPGTAPGSEWFIATAIYFHSRRTGALNIGGKSLERQWPPAVLSWAKAAQKAWKHAKLALASAQLAS